MVCQHRPHSDESMPLRLNTVKQFANAFGRAWLINTAFGARDPQIPLGKGNLSYGYVQVSISCRLGFPCPRHGIPTFARKPHYP
jgi:hypothetical protein